MAFNTAGAAAGAAAGAVAGPWGAAIGGIAGGFMGGSGGATGSSSGGATATPQASQAAAFGSGIDGSAWVVQFGDGNTSTLDNRQDKHIDSTGPTATANPSAGIRPASPYFDGGMAYGGGDPLGMAALGLGGIPPLVWLVLGAAVLYRIGKKKH